LVSTKGQGVSNDFTTTFDKQLVFPEDESSEWRVTLVSAQVPNTFFNISAKQGNNKFYFKLKTDLNFTILTIPDGFYSVSALSDFLLAQIGTATLSGEQVPIVELIPDDVQLKVIMRIIYPFEVAFSFPDTPRLLLGFDPTIYDSDVANQVKSFTAQNQPDITNKQDHFYISVDLISSSFSRLGPAPANVIYGFSFSVASGSAQLLTPSEHVYLPLSRNYFDSINCRILNQDGQTVDLNNEIVVVNLLVKRVSKQGSLMF
jgi:hypothetical protein